jgi:hypothetical protein
MNATDVINRVRNLKEFTVVTDLPEEFYINGVVPFDMRVDHKEITALILAESFDEAAGLLDAWLYGQSR